MGSRLFRDFVIIVIVLHVLISDGNPIGAGTVKPCTNTFIMGESGFRMTVQKTRYFRAVTVPCRSGDVLLNLYFYLES